MTQMEIQAPTRNARAGYKVDVSRGQRVGRVSSEWFNRPADERYLSLTDLRNSVRARSQRSRTRVVESERIRVEASRDDAERLMLIDRQRPAQRRHPHLARRFRHRPVVARPPARLPFRQAEDRPRLRRLDPRGPAIAAYHPRHPRHVRRARHGGRGRRHRGGGAGGETPSVRLRRRPGIPVRTAGRRRRHAGISAPHVRRRTARPRRLKIPSPSAARTGVLSARRLSPIHSRREKELHTWQSRRSSRT